LIKLKSKDLVLKIEEDVAGLLGVDVNKKEDSGIELTHVGMTDQIVSSLGLKCDKSLVKSTPAKYGCLGMHEEGKEFIVVFNYRINVQV
jgi:hypothetical protein